MASGLTRGTLLTYDHRNHDKEEYQCYYCCYNDHLFKVYQVVGRLEVIVVKVVIDYINIGFGYFIRILGHGFIGSSWHIEFGYRKTFTAVGTVGTSTSVVRTTEQA